jgi:hypothetical protein
VRKTHALLIALGIVVLSAVAIVVAVQVYLPRYVEERVVAEAKARGIDLRPGEISFG